MADIIFLYDSFEGDNILRRAQDMGDGSWADVVVLGANDGEIGSVAAGTALIGYVAIMANMADVLTAVGGDPVSSALQVITPGHKETHAGNHYYLEGHQTLDTGIIYRMKMVVPAGTKVSHMLWTIASSGITESTLDEEASGGMAGGSPVVPLNSDRNSENASGMVFAGGVAAASAYVARVSIAKWGALGKFNHTGGGAGREDEILLLKGATYLQTFTSSTDANIIQFRASWYEHVPNA